jgi:signal transduction histidine kinase
MQVSKTLNDSVQYYMHIGQAKKAYFLLQRALIQKSIPENEQARAFFLMGKLKETEGYDEEAYSNYMRAGSLAVKQNLPALQAMSWSGAANVLVSLERLDSALLLCKISQVLDSTVKSKTANMLVMARYSQNKDQLDQAMGYFKQAAGLALSIKEKEMLGLAYSGIATIYYNQYTDMEQALHFFTKAVKAFDSLQSANIMAHTYVRIANVWMVRNNGQQANLYLERARRIVEISENMPTKAYLLSSLAIFKSEGGDLKEVVKYAEQALQIKRKLGQRRKILNDLLNLSIWYMELKQYSKSRNYLQEGIAISRELHDPIHFHYYYETMAQLDSVSGNLGSAFSNLKKAHLYKDSAYSLSKVKALEEISKKYENEQKEKTIAEKELVIEKQKYQLSIIVGISIISILSVLAFLFWRLSLSRSRFQKEQERQNTVRLQTIVNTQEAVQQRIARDIHDGLVQVMGAAKLSLQAVKIDGDRDIIQQRIREASVIIDEACTETRMLSHQILPYSLMKGGLLPALEELFKKSLMEIQFSFNHNVGEARFDQDIEINIYRVAQEIVQNIVKHSGATSVEANLTLEKKMLTLSIADNGKGFDKTTAHSNAGLTNISTRAQLIKATLFMNTQHGAGTKVQLQLEV